MPRAEADPQCFAHAVLPLAHAVARSVTETVKCACREVATERCVDSPKTIEDLVGLGLFFFFFSLFSSTHPLPSVRTDVPATKTYFMSHVSEASLR